MERIKKDIENLIEKIIANYKKGEGDKINFAKSTLSQIKNKKSVMSSLKKFGVFLFKTRNEDAVVFILLQKDLEYAILENILKAGNIKSRRLANLLDEIINSNEVPAGILHEIKVVLDVFFEKLELDEKYFKELVNEINKNIDKHIEDLKKINKEGD